MTGFRVGLVTCGRFLNEVPEDKLVQSALGQLGHSADLLPWDNSEVDWSAYDALVIRSAWNYQSSLSEFLSWVNRIEGLGVRLYNSPDVLRWNCRKTYLQDLRAGGVRIPETVWVEATEPIDLPGILREHGWSEAVVKPNVGAGGALARRISLVELEENGVIFEAELLEHGILVQEFLPEIVETGEWSLVFFSGEFSHAVIKTPATGDFRVQEEHGGSYIPVTPSDELVRQAKEILNHAPEELLYARVDGVVRNTELILLELEALEPSFYSKHAEHCPEMFAKKLIDRVIADGR